MADGKKKIQINADWYETFKEMADDKAGWLIKNILAYCNDLHPEREMEKGSMDYLLFLQFKNQLDASLAKWKQKCDKNRENVNKRWNTNVNENIPNDTNVYDRIPTYKKNTDKIREDKIRQDISSLHSLIAACVCKNGLTQEDFENIIGYLEANGITEVKYPDALVKSYIKKKDVNNNPKWLKEAGDSIESRVRHLEDQPEWLQDYVNHLEEGMESL